MGSYSNEDHTKFVYALLARDIRRLTARVHRADIDDDTRKMIDAALDQLETRVWVMAFQDPATGILIKHEDVYADGRPVTPVLAVGHNIQIYARQGLLPRGEHRHSLCCRLSSHLTP